MKRFYKQVSVGPANVGPASVDPASGEQGGYAVLLDGRPIRSPAKRALDAPTEALAQVMAEEWDAQGEKIIPADMPITALPYPALDHIGPNRDAILAELAGYGETDLICYFAGDDRELMARQEAAWRPMLVWSEGDLGIALKETTGIMPVTQDADVSARFMNHLSGFDDWRLAAISEATSLSGSIVLGLALACSAIDADGLYQASLVDELYQAENWGSDHEADERRRNILASLANAERYLGLL